MAQNGSFSLNDVQGFGESSPAPSSAAPSAASTPVAGSSAPFSFSDIDHDATSAAATAAGTAANTPATGLDAPLVINGETIDPSDPDYMILKRAQQVHENLPPMLKGMAKATGRDVLSLMSLGGVRIPGLSADSIPAPSGKFEDIGEGLETALMTYFGEGAAKDILSGSRLYDLAAKYPKLQEVLSVAEKSPWLQKIIGRTLQQGTYGGAIGALKGSQTGNTLQGAKTGATLGAASGAVTGAVEGAPKLPAWLNPFRTMPSGKEVAAPETAAAVKGGVRSAAEATAGGPVTAPVAAGIEASPIIQGPETVFDDTMSAIQQKGKQAYAAMDKVAQFDYKEASDQLANDEYKLKQLGNTPADQTQRNSLTAAIADTRQRLADADTRLKAAGINPNDAPAMFKRLKAGQDIKAAVVTATDTDGNVDATKLLNRLKTLRVSKRGDRLAQFLGSPEAADKFTEALQSARATGSAADKAAESQKIKADVFKKILMGLGGLGATAAAGYGGAKVYQSLH